MGGVTPINNYELIDLLISLALWVDAQADTEAERQQVWDALVEAIQRPP